MIHEHYDVRGGTQHRCFASATEGFYDWQDGIRLELHHTGIVQNIQLDNLDVVQVEALLADSLNKEIDQVKDLAPALFRFTHGNLFFMKHLLQRLQDDQILTFDYNSFQWTWDVDLIRRRGSLSDNVVETLAKRIHHLHC